MLGKTASQGSYKDYSNAQSGPVEPCNIPKNYKSYVNFQGSSQQQPRQMQREPDHVAMYTLNVSPHPNPKRESQNTPVTINRNPYINGPIQLRKDPPKQNPNRYSNSKDQFPSRQSQELIKNKTEVLKSAQKSNSISSKGLNSSLNHSMNKTNSQMSDYPSDLGCNTYNQTVDLGSISRNQSIAQSVTSTPEEELLQQKLSYLQFLEQSIRQFENSQNVKVLQNLNESNRRVLMNYYSEISKQREERSRKNISDCVSQSDNLSEDAFSVDARSDYTSLSIQSEKNKFIDGFNRSRQKSQQRDSELASELRLHQKLEREYNELMNAGNKNANQLLKIESEIKNLQSESSKLVIKNNEIKSKLSKFPFYQEWMLMSDEADGARKTEIRLKQQLRKRKSKLSEVKEESNKDGSASQYTNKRKSQETSSKQKAEEQKERVSSLSKNMASKPKMQPIPMPSRPLENSQGESTGNRVIQDSSLRIMGVSHQARNKSINRTANN